MAILMNCTMSNESFFPLRFWFLHFVCVDAPREVETIDLSVCPQSTSVSGEGASIIRKEVCTWNAPSLPSLPLPLFCVPFVISSELFRVVLFVHNNRTPILFSLLVVLLLLNHSFLTTYHHPYILIFLSVFISLYNMRK